MSQGRAQQTCGATTRAGHPCRKPAGWGTPHDVGRCKLHGGATPNGQRAARVTLAREQVQALGLPLGREDPSDVLLEEVRRSAVIVRWLHDRVAELGDLFDEDGLNPVVALWERQRRHLADVAARAVAVGVARRHVELAEEQGRMAGEFLLRTLARLGIDTEEPAVRSIMRQELYLLSGGDAG